MPKGVKGSITHGGAYNAGCRCDLCREGHRVRTALRQAERVALFAAGEVDVEHGTKSTYANYGCRCEPCTRANHESWVVGYARALARGVDWRKSSQSPLLTRDNLSRWRQIDGR